jgi:L-ribulokinase
MLGIKDRVSTTNAAHGEIYERLYRLYGQLHDPFGGVHDSTALGNIIKDLLERKEPSVSTQLS